MSKDIDEVGFGAASDALANILGGLVDHASAERQKTDSYKELFGKGSSLTGLFRHQDFLMESTILEVCEVLEQKHNLKITAERYEFILALPYLAHKLEKEIKEKETYVCSVDKVYYILSERFKALAV